MLKKRKAEPRFFLACGLVLSMLLSQAFLAGCGNGGGADGKKETAEENSLEDRQKEISSQLLFESSLDLQYAEQFAVDYYEGGSALVSAADGRQYLVLPEGENPPEDLDEKIVVLKQPLEHVYLAATAVMDMVCELDALDFLRFSSQKAEGWSLSEAREEMKNGHILYAGKYSMPDYEMIVSGGCSLAIENNMISHTPEVMEKLEDFGIPVWIDRSSYEDHPLGRAEWVKLYGVLFGKEKEAAAAFQKQADALEHVAREEPSGKTVAFFFLTAGGSVNVRAGNDYVPKMIELAGGRYIFEDLGEKESRRSTVNLQMEEFYHMAKDADYLIYNSTIDGGMESLEELLEKESLLGDFRAVQEGQVWCTARDMYQQSMSVGQMIEEIHLMLSGDADRQTNMRYLSRLL